METLAYFRQVSFILDVVMAVRVHVVCMFFGVRNGVRLLVPLRRHIFVCFCLTSRRFIRALQLQRALIVFGFAL